MKIKLRPKQLAIIQASQARKQELNKAIADLTASENIIVELALEEAGVTGQVTNLKLDGDDLSYDLVLEKPKAKGKAKGKAKMEVVKQD